MRQQQRIPAQGTPEEIAERIARNEADAARLRADIPKEADFDLKNMLRENLGSAERVLYDLRRGIEPERFN